MLGGGGGGSAAVGLGGWLSLIQLAVTTPGLHASALWHVLKIKIKRGGGGGIKEVITSCEINVHMYPTEWGAAINFVTGEPTERFPRQ